MPPVRPPLTRRQIYRRRRVAVFGTTGALLAGLLYLPLTLLAPIAPAAADVVAEQPIATPAPVLDWPGYGRGAIGFLDEEGTLASYGDETAFPMASITKLITALVVLDKHPLAAGESGPSITMSAADVAFHQEYRLVRAKVLPVWSGLSFTERELLDITLIESAANYATSLATWSHGSEAEFVAAARAWLDDHGLSGIRYVEPTGLDAGNTATPAELLELGRIALAHPIVKEIVGTASVTVHDVGLLENTNELLGLSGVNGIKTGTLDDFGANLLFSTDVPAGDSTVPIIGVVLGGPGPKHDILDADVQQLIASITASFHVVSLTDPGEVFADYETAWGDEAAAIADTATTMVVWGDTAVEMSVSVPSVGVAEARSATGEVVFRSGDQTVTVPLVLSEDVDDPGPWWRLGHPGLIVGAP